ncbi:hypothetical protein THAOC_10668, partial [Thalassiosira oceanica]
MPAFILDLSSSLLLRPVHTLWSPLISAPQHYFKPIPSFVCVLRVSLRPRLPRQVEVVGCEAEEWKPKRGGVDCGHGQTYIEDLRWKVTQARGGSAQHRTTMARGNQREMSREKNLAKQQAKLKSQSKVKLPSYLTFNGMLGPDSHGRSKSACGNGVT